VSLRQPRRSRDPDLHVLGFRFRIHLNLRLRLRRRLRGRRRRSLWTGETGDTHRPPPPPRRKLTPTTMYSDHPTPNSQLPETTPDGSVAPPCPCPKPEACLHVHNSVSVSVSAALGPRDLMHCPCCRPRTSGLGPIVAMRSRAQILHIALLRRIDQLISVSCEYNRQGVREYVCNSPKSQVTSHKSQVTSHESRITNHIHREVECRVWSGSKSELKGVRVGVSELKGVPEACPKRGARTRRVCRLW
jgi:hypothetical protein